MLIGLQLPSPNKKKYVTLSFCIPHVDIVRSLVKTSMLRISWALLGSNSSVTNWITSFQALWCIRSATNFCNSPVSFMVSITCFAARNSWTVQSMKQNWASLAIGSSGARPARSGKRWSNLQSSNPSTSCVDKINSRLRLWKILLVDMT